MSGQESFYRRFWKRFLKDAAPWARDNILWGIVVLLTPAIAVYIREHRVVIDWTTLWFYLIALAIYVFVHLWRTAKKLDDDHNADEKLLKARIVTRNQTIDLLGQPDSPALRPNVVGVEYAIRELDNRSGLFLQNENDTTAYDVSVAEILVGASKLHFWGKALPRLSKSEGKVLLESAIKTPDGGILSGNGLFQEMVQQKIESVSLTISYKDANNQHYATDCLIERDVLAKDGLAVRFTKQTLVTREKNQKPPAPSHSSVHQEVTQEISPQITINPQFNIGTLAAAAPALAPVVKSKPEPRHNIRFVDMVCGEREQMYIFSKFAGQSLSYATAKFENEVIKGQGLLTPTVKARAIYRRFDGSSILDMSNLPWIPGAGDTAYATFEASTPKYLLLFFLANNKRFCRSVESVSTRIRGGKRVVSESRDCEIKDPIASVEVRLLTNSEQVYAVVLNFMDSDNRLIPHLTGHEEL